VTNEVTDTNDPPVTTTNVTTNIVTHGFHIFMVDAYGLGYTQQAAVHTMRLHSTNIVVDDNYLVIGELLFDGENLENFGNLILDTPTGNFGWTNAPGLKTLRNEGTIEIGNNAAFSIDRAVPYERFVNAGDLEANSIRIAADAIENSGEISAATYLQLRSPVAKLQNGFMNSGGDMLLEVDNLKLHRTTNSAQRALTFSVTESFADSGGPVSSQFSCNRGFQLHTKPPLGDLLGTRFITSASPNAFVDHTWPAEDRGVDIAGYNNNLAIGRLVLSAGRDGVLRLHGPAGAGPYAVYVDYLDLQGFVQQAYGQDRLADYLRIDSNVTIYFAGANVPVEDLDGQLGGRLRWVMDFVGPNSSVVVGLPSGGTVQMNRGRRESLRIDDDGDGVANGYDPYPWPDPRATATVVETSPFTVMIGWTAAPMTTYRVEVAGEASGPWESLALVTNGEPTVQPMTVEDTPSNGGGLRFYRVRQSQ
jgi:hypothetical protein